MRHLFLPAMLSIAALLAACGERPRGEPSDAARQSASSRSGDASAEAVAEEARGKVRCPARIETPGRSKNAPVADVVGVRPGITFDEAANVVLCTHELMVVSADTRRRFNIQTYGQTIRQGFSAKLAEPRVQKTSQEIMREMQDRAMARANNKARDDMKPGQTKWYVSTMGMPGAERVIAAAREEWFEEGRNPTLANVEQALRKKYGTPTQTWNRNGKISLTWAYDPFGRPITETSPLFHRCRGMADPDGGTNFSPDCGIVVAAEVAPTRENPGLARYLQVGTMDQAGGYEAITGTEQALAQLDAERRAKELEAASQNADTPQL